MESGLADQLNVGVPRFGRTDASGGARLKARNRLPQVFIVYTMKRPGKGEPNIVTAYGTVCVFDCTSFDPSAHPSVPQQCAAWGLFKETSVTQWHCRDARFLRAPVVLTDDDCKSWKGVCHFDYSQRVRDICHELGVPPKPRGLRVVGHNIAMDIVRVRLPIVVFPASYCSQAGIAPRQLERALPVGGVSRPPALASSARARSRSPMPRSMADDGAPPISDVSRPAPLGSVAKARSRSPPVLPENALSLRARSADNAQAQRAGFATKAQSQHDAGAVAFTYSPRVVILAWAIAQMMSAKRTSLPDIVVMAVRLARGNSEAAVVEEAIRDGSLRIPGRELIRQTSFKLNALDILYQRELNQSHDSFRYVAADASKQGQFNFYVIQEDRVMWPRSAPGEVPAILLDGGFKMERRHLPTTTLGLGAADLKYKVSSTCHSIMLESGGGAGGADIDSWRWGVRSWTSDQGLAYSIGDGPCLASSTSGGWHDAIAAVRSGERDITNPASQDAFMFPAAIAVPDMLHVMYNALELSVCCLETWTAWHSKYRAVAHFLGSALLRRRFIATCTPAKEATARAVVEAWSCGTQFTWKWEYLLRFVTELMKVIDFLVAYWDEAKVKESEAIDGNWGISELNANAISDFSAALADPMELRLHTLVLQSVSLALQTQARWCEGCWCHEHLLASSPFNPLLAHNRFQRWQRLSQGCPWKSRRGAEIVCGRLEQMLAAIAGATTVPLQLALAACDESERDTYLGMELEIKRKLLEQVALKLDCWRSLPFSILGVAIGRQGGTTEQAKLAAKSCIAERDEAIRNGRGSKLHKVAQRLLVRSDLPFRTRFEAFANGEEMPDMLAHELTGYALALLTTRRTEAAHAVIKVNQRKSLWMIPSLLNVRIKAGELLSLTKDERFLIFAKQKWHTRCLQRSLLFGFFSNKMRVMMMTPQQVAGHLYVFSMEAQYRPQAQEAASLQDWRKSVVPAMKPITEPLSKSETTVLRFLQHCCATPGALWSLPADVFEMASTPLRGQLGNLQGRGVSDGGLAKAFEAKLLQLSDGGISADNQVFFVVTNAKPDLQVVVRPDHKVHDPTCISVVRQTRRPPSTGEPGRHLMHRLVPLKISLRPLLTPDGASKLLHWPVEGTSSCLVLQDQIAREIADEYVHLVVGGEAPLPVHHVVDACMRQGAIAGSGVAIGFVALCIAVDNFSENSLQRFVSHGILHRGQDEFGEDAVSLSTDVMVWRRMSSSVSPVSVLAMSQPRLEMCTSKLCLMLHLLSKGWKGSDNDLPDLTAGGRLELAYRMLGKSCMYWQALRNLPDLWRRGWQSVRHFMPDGYYKCVLQLRGPDIIAEFEQHPKLLQFKHADYEAFLRGKPLPINAELIPALEDQAADERDEPNVEVEVELPPLAEGAIAYPVASAHVRFKHVSVTFDGCSHTSGGQRGYTACLNKSHKACYKYRQIDGFESWEPCAAWLAAWNMMGLDNCEGKEDHKHLEPYPTVVEQLQADLVVVDVGSR